MMRPARLSAPLLVLAVAVPSGPLAAQDYDHSQMDPSQMEHSAHKPAPMPAPPAQDPAQMDHPQHESMDHSQHEPLDHSQHESMDRSQHHGMDHSQNDAPGLAAHAVPHDETPPPRAFEGPRHAAETIYGEAPMARAREIMVQEMGGTYRTASLMVERLETRLGEHDAYLWDVQGFIGGDLDRLVIKTEGEGSFAGELEHGEVQALWSHAIGPFFDAQAGIRQDLQSGGRTHAVIGVQGLAPYMIHLDASAFLSDRGDLTARIEAEYDQKITQRLILQPRAEIALSAQDMPEQAIGSGLSSIEAGLRLRYEIVPESAPYVGIAYEAALGDGADYSRAAGEDPDDFALLLGLRTWF